MDKRESLLLSPLKVGEVTLKNRFVVAPMVTVFCDQDGMATDRFIAYHEAKARGGWGLIIVEDYAVDPIGRGFWTPGLWKDEQIPSHARLVEAVHKAGAKIIAQIYHAGRQTSSALVGAQPVSASPVPCPVMGEVPRELAREEIATIVRQFGETALRAKKAGFDGVEVHGAHGYLIAQFMSRYSNKRTDGYGGPLKNRLRFPLEIIAEIRKRCGQDFLIDFRISGDEHVPGGRTIEETKVIAAALEEAGLNMIHVSVGTYESVASIIPPMGTRLAWITDYAAEVKKAVKIPVVTVGRINDPLVAEEVLRSGKADLIAMGRGSLADPELPNKYAQGRYEDIRHCIGCQQGCLEILFRNEPIRCLVNPTLGFEYKEELKKASQPKKVTVVGGGPAGLEAARAAATAGHRVTLYEREDRLGGQFLAAAVPPGKGEITSYLAWAERQLEKLGVTVKLNTPYDEAAYRQDEAEVVIVATGACQTRPPIEGIDGKNVVTARDVLMGKATTGPRVVVAGGGMVGCETATFLASMGKAVAIVEMLPAIATDEEITRRAALLKMLEEKKVEVHTSAEIKAITEKAVRVTKGGTDLEIPADTVVLALGMASECVLTDSGGKAAEVKIVGDAVNPRNALEAIREGFLAGAGI
ncbi:MAG TPA: FAD-dependent oxidoreductase [Syntrophales bacterium]|nr:FAD-dependent oxidoreductase [Syntrophales bacterium]HOO00804.1 FAD-dependent oxidoreductase [Syntrophales bacterium]HPC01964.1 FAD-dependent oxidoreductase [Syntrophales bacterium]HRS87887.1 FAD-dependent oxidoreductase [Syntrophales bacterium]HRV42226.1 FAD-dependent oxidoreductase [Syntrophales bacterium]